MNSQFITRTVWASPSNKIRNSRITRNEGKMTRRAIKDNKNIAAKSAEKPLIKPIANYPLEIPKISRLVYQPKNPIQAKRPDTYRKSPDSLLGTEESSLPYLSKRKNQRNSSIPMPNQVDISQIVNNRWEFSERIYWNKRKNTILPLAIIVFEGVIGDFYKQNLWETRSSDMSLCPGWIKGLSLIYQKAFICIISSLSLDKCEFILNLFSHNSVKIDAFYIRKGKQLRYAQDYSQILDEFPSPYSILLSSIGLDSDDIRSRNSWDLIYEPSMSYHKKICTSMWPVGYLDQNDPPVILLIPNPRAQEKENCILFGEISIAVLKVLKCLRKAYMLDEICIESKGVLRHCTIPQDKFDSNAKGDYEIVVLTGVDAHKRPYFKYYFHTIKNQIDLTKFHKYVY